uniref:AbiV family abortive infection protein n=1 Tax=Bursaphelenchus xylophilus TaxID=6326 RepID=A0A1I7SMG5_BURXY
MFIRTKSNFRMAQNSNDVIRQLQKELDEKAGPYVSEEYLKLARKFATKKISLAIFEKKAKGLIPIDLHSRFILNIADFMDMSLDECFKRTRKRKKSLAEEIFDQIYYHLISVGLSGVIFNKEDARCTVSEIIKYARLVDSDVQTNSFGFSYLDPIRTKKEISLKDVVNAVEKFHWLLEPRMAKDFSSMFGI